MHIELPDTIQAARVRLAQKRPYLAGLLYRLVPVAQPGLKTMAVDKYARLYFDPEAKWSVDVYTTVLYHEVCHLLRDHAGRGESLGITPETPENAVAWNVAADAEINDDVIREGFNDWPFQVVTPGSLNQKDGLFAEEYYAAMPKTGAGAGKGKGNAPQPGNGQCGGCAGNPHPGEAPAPPTAGGKKDAEPGLSQAEMEATRHKVASDIRDHAKTQGDVPGHLKDWAQAILNPKVDWRKVLRSAIRHAMADIAGMVNFTYQRPSRRTMPKVILPSLRQPVPNIAVVVDTSGSMSDNDLAMVLGEVNGVLKQCGQRTGVDAIVCDATVHSARRVFKADQIVMAGRGGTDMRIGVQAALERPVRPHAVIILTDGYTPWPAEAPSGVRIIAALVGKSRCDASHVPTWIKVVEVDE